MITAVSGQVHLPAVPSNEDQWKCHIRSSAGPQERTQAEDMRSHSSAELGPSIALRAVGGLSLDADAERTETGSRLLGVIDTRYIATDGDDSAGSLACFRRDSGWEHCRLGLEGSLTQILPTALRCYAISEDDGIVNALSMQRLTRLASAGNAVGRSPYAYHRLLARE